MIIISNKLSIKVVGVSLCHCVTFLPFWTNKLRPVITYLTMTDFIAPSFVSQIINSVNYGLLTADHQNSVLEILGL